MAVDICPTVTVDTLEAYNQQVELLAKFALRIHIDLSDGVFAPAKLVSADNVWWPGGIRADLHVMYAHPLDYLDTYLALAPQLVIIHAETGGDIEGFSKILHHHGIEFGLALLPQTKPQTIESVLGVIDHVLIFSGRLGYYGGQADMQLLQKVEILKKLRPNLEIGWDGGVNDQNLPALISGGVEVLNVGGYIAEAESPIDAYAKLKMLTLNKNRR